MKKFFVLTSLIICLFILIGCIQLLMDGKPTVDIHIHDTYFVVGRNQIKVLIILITLLVTMLIRSTVGLNIKRK